MVNLAAMQPAHLLYIFLPPFLLYQPCRPELYTGQGSVGIYRPNFIHDGGTSGGYIRIDSKSMMEALGSDAVQAFRNNWMSRLWINPRQGNGVLVYAEASDGKFLLLSLMHTVLKLSVYGGSTNPVLNTCDYEPSLYRVPINEPRSLVISLDMLGESRYQIQVPPKPIQGCNTSALLTPDIIYLGGMPDSSKIQVISRFIDVGAPSLANYDGAFIRFHMSVFAYNINFFHDLLIMDSDVLDTRSANFQFHGNIEEFHGGECASYSCEQNQVCVHSDLYENKGAECVPCGDTKCQPPSFDQPCTKSRYSDWCLCEWGLDYGSYDYTELSAMIGKCASVLPVLCRDPSVCRNGGTCVPTSYGGSGTPQQVTCRCTEHYTGTHCDQQLCPCGLTGLTCDVTDTATCLRTRKPCGAATPLCLTTLLHTGCRCFLGTPDSTDLNCEAFRDFCSRDPCSVYPDNCYYKYHGLTCTCRDGKPVASRSLDVE